MKTKDDIERKARAILRKLSKSGTILLPVIGEAGEFGVYSSSVPGGKARIKVSSEFVRAFLTRDWLEKVRDGYVISDAGHSWLKRLESGADPFRGQHQVIAPDTIETSNGITSRVKINHMESPLEWLSRRKDKKGKPLINNIQYKAGDRLRNDFTFAGLSPRITANWSAVSRAAPKRKHGGQQPVETDMQENVIEAKERFRKALDFIGPEMSGIVVDVCCHLKGLEETEKSRGWPRRSGKVVLQIALTRLARYYGLEGISGNSYAKMQHSGSEDYRPEI
ncbi:MAG: DUF6456 domain-containing protein [Methyloligellaceae bacterium]